MKKNSKICIKLSWKDWATNLRKERTKLTKLEVDWKRQASKTKTTWTDWLAKKARCEYNWSKTISKTINALSNWPLSIKINFNRNVITTCQVSETLLFSTLMKSTVLKKLLKPNNKKSDVFCKSTVCWRRMKKSALLILLPTTMS